MDELSESYWGPREITSHVINLGWKTKEIVQLPEEKPFILPSVWVTDTWPGNFPSQMTVNCQEFQPPAFTF